MKALRDRSSTWQRPRRASPWLALLVVALLAAGGAVYAATRGGGTTLACSGTSCTTGSGSSAGGSGHGGSSSSPGGSASPSGHRRAHALRVSSTTPAPGSTGVAPNTQVTVTFDAALEPGGPMPTLSPEVAGSWQRASPDELVFTPAAPFVPFKRYTLTIPGGRGGIGGTSGTHLAKTHAVAFTVADGSTLRLQQLLAELGYLPVSYSAPTPSAQDMATPQPGTFAWRWSGLPLQLTDQWVPGSQSAITKGAVMMFETENGLSVDGIAGPAVWTALLRDVVSHKTDTEPVTYVLVTKVEPEHLTAWVNGALEFNDILVNTGVAGANTTDGTFQVFEHVLFSDMKGTNVTGTKYTDPHVPWASYFDRGEALHGFPRASYGWPQSNGCVEMPIATAGKLWPDTPIGTVVTVIGPNVAGAAPPAATRTTPTSTTTTTASTSTTTTTTPTTTTTTPPTTTTTTTTPTTTTTTTPTTTTTTTTTTTPTATADPSATQPPPAG